MKTRLLVPVLASALILSTAVPATLAATYEWGFTAGDLTADLGPGIMDYRGTTAGLTTFGTTDGSTVPHLNGVPTTYMSFGQWPTPETDYGYTLEFSASTANGGGAYINQYTIIYDVLIPGALDWTPLFNTQLENNNDADWYVRDDGALGIGELGYSAAGVIQPDQWYRLGFTADLGAGDVRYYVDGTQVFASTGASGLLDDRFSLYSNADAGPDLLIANEGDTSGNYTHAQIYSAIAFTDRTLSDAEFAALGGPSADGIFVPEPSNAVLFAVGAFFFWAVLSRARS